ncbi:ferredoxin-thioredoxin reductase catalytic domain-containing protein [Sulfurovum mangrovi]|uniref:ferredoxin-thioredoxin reductase catalytic domain-containing protein n=1 Tax=Sulfurovum mangrovi TaxID=2893889 RepID=UPI001E6300BB|nr:ferredoxin-thioredoxin reductase catalytic domain-containing protein [Sulfurovum mangrovi]UFH59192.1 sulfurtransferase [Sulfurovum mangrovi]
MQQIDINSDEFQAELEKTWQFVEKVNTQFGFVQNPNEEVNEGVAMGLARNRLIYGKRFCPCFMVIGETKEEQKAADNRICPCKPALEKEIPEDGLCHCGIFCTPEYAAAQQEKDTAEEVAHTHSQGLTRGQAVALLNEEQLDGDELEALLEARALRMVDFTLMDVREYMEYQMGHIVGTDTLVPTSQFYAKIEEHADKKQKPVIVYCHTGSRSFQVQHAMKSLGFEHVCNLRPGIIAYNGETQRGE